MLLPQPGRAGEPEGPYGSGVGMNKDQQAPGWAPPSSLPRCCSRIVVGGGVILLRKAHCFPPRPGNTEFLQAGVRERARVPKGSRAGDRGRALSTLLRGR